MDDTILNNNNNNNNCEMGAWCVCRGRGRVDYNEQRKAAEIAAEIAGQILI